MVAGDRQDSLQHFVQIERREHSLAGFVQNGNVRHSKEFYL
jgi:hypothetical protein